MKTLASIAVLFFLTLSAFAQTSATRLRFGTYSVSASGGGSSTITNGMMGFWAMDQSTTSNEPDLITGTNTLVVSAGDSIPVSAIVQGDGRDFEAGDDDYITSSTNSAIDLGLDTSFTLLCWVNLETASVVKPLIKKPGSFSTSVSGGNVLSFVVVGSTNTTLNGPTVGVGTNYMLAFIHNATNNTLEIYDFEPSGPKYYSASHNAGTTNNGSALWVSAVETDTTQNWDGVIAHIGVWHRSVSSNELSTLYNGGSGVAWPWTGL